SLQERRLVSPSIRQDGQPEAPRTICGMSAPSRAVHDTIRPMSYDFAVLTPESVGVSGHEALAAAGVGVEQGHFAGAGQDRRLRDFVTDLAEAGAADEENGWVSVWPLDIGRDGVAVPTTYADVDSNLITLLRLAARHGLVLVDLNAET